MPRSSIYFLLICWITLLFLYVLSLFLIPQNSDLCSYKRILLAFPHLWLTFFFLYNLQNAWHNKYLVTIWSSSWKTIPSSCYMFESYFHNIAGNSPLSGSGSQWTHLYLFAWGYSGICSVLLQNLLLLVCCFIKKYSSVSCQCVFFHLGK